MVISGMHGDRPLLRVIEALRSPTLRPFTHVHTTGVDTAAANIAAGVVRRGCE